MTEINITQTMTATHEEVFIPAFRSEFDPQTAAPVPRPFPLPRLPLP